MWQDRLAAVCDLDAFSRRRLDELLAAARLFDTTGSRSLLDFIEFCDAYAVTDLPAENAVHVMTMHKSKGLGFDLVLLPDLQYRGITSARRLELGVGRGPPPEREARWVLRLPPRKVAEADPVLGRYVEEADRDACFEELCLLYVALTRAMEQLYVFGRVRLTDLL